MTVRLACGKEPYHMLKPNGSTAAFSSTSIVNPTFMPDVAGVYLLSLVVNDGSGNSTPSTVTVTVAKANSVPVANAGNNQNVSVGSLVTLDGSKSSDADNDLLTYQWNIVSKPAGSTYSSLSGNVVNPTFTPDLTGTYVFNLFVNDGYVNSAASSVTITVNKANSIPVANAGTAQNVVAGSIVTLDGSKSSDADGDLITYSWSFTSKPNGSNVALSNFAVVNPTFTPDVAGAYVLNLVANDGKVNSVAVPVTINAAKVNTAPVANAGILQNVVQGAIVTLDGSKSSDADGDLITYSWSFTSKPVGSAATLTNSTIVNPKFTADAVGAYVLNLIVNDGKVNSPVSTVTINAAKANSAPVANAGLTQNVLKGATVTLNGSTSSDADGDTLTYNWAFTSKPVGSTATLTNSTTVNPKFTPDVVGAYVINLVVNDGKVNSAVATITVNVSRTNVAPVANAGVAQNVFTGSIVTLDGSASSDADVDPLTYKWAFTSKPAGSTVVLSSTAASKPTFTPDIVGAYVLNLIVNDGIVDSAVSTVTINASLPNAVPVANAGANPLIRSIRTGKVFTLDGSSSSDTDNDPLTYSWSFDSKPVGSNATLSQPTTVHPTFTPDINGSYVIALKVNDGKIDSLTSNISLTAVSDLTQMFSSQTSKSYSMFNNYYQAGSQFTATAINISNETFPLTKYEFKNGSTLLSSTTDPTLLNNNSLSPGQRVAITTTLSTSQLNQGLTANYYFTDPNTGNSIAVQISF
jgi:hypothetical protein